MLSNRTARLLVVAIAFAVVALTVDAAWACPSCKESLSASQANLARGFYFSILFMMSMPFLILFGIGGYFYWQIRKALALAAQTAAGDNQPAHQLNSPVTTLPG